MSSNGMIKFEDWGYALFAQIEFEIPLYLKDTRGWTFYHSWKIPYYHFGNIPKIVAYRYAIYKMKGRLEEWLVMIDKAVEYEKTLQSTKKEPTVPDNVVETLRKIWGSAREPQAFSWIHTPASQLWQDWFEFSGDPWVDGGDMHIDYCFFCKEDKPSHAPDCVFVRAQNMLANNPKG